MPSSPGYKRNLKQERRTAIRRGETGVGHNSKDAVRHRARRAMIKKVGKAAVRGKDVDHIKMLKHGGSNSTTNLRIRSKHENRSRNGHNPKRKR